MQQGGIEKLLGNLRDAQVQKNRNYLKAIISVTALCARQCIALRGHDEGSLSSKRGNVREILDVVA
ncbi:hypothetical protein Pmar_PMAR003784 [Perkinsus marinus ATCC 50983]|uniref:DUF4371 domain-containing protein n=1 Tax=Perkinsus marinus (strain ATCC 50983 / TXsc) TaxID=423536 RepID=C5LV51_PERM5|nr:hypothetical protein Pmar_PMAR003784 [Perkinsus marinus ATCC 50983]EEQ99390.1 hypothetical protein Pmar_PMAR003784 [Perkinsus marinus ATCC 50983]|eukprot:XP_002766673.1 hypothetical protein Pmar_PMAR003784 [Perkinsus marinus ATCC 50983]